MMLQQFQLVGDNVLTLALMIAVGFFFGRCGKLSEATLSQVSYLLLYLVCPAVMVDTFLSQPHTGQAVHTMLTAGAVMAGTYALNAMLAQLCFRGASGEEGGILRFSAIYGNTGFMGIPLVQAVLGSEGAVVAVISLAAFQIFTWTHGMCLIGGRGSLSARSLLLNPGVIGFVLAVILFAVRAVPPAPLADAIAFVADLNTPLAMIVIGGQISAVNLREVLGNWRVFAACAIKLLLIPLATMLVLLPFRLDQTVYTATVILAGCPVAGVASLFSQLAGKEPALAARLIALSTLFCVVTLPVVATVARSIAP